MARHSVLHWIRARQQRLMKVVLALFCLAWLQVAAMPCAMADDVKVAPAHDCPYCPATVVQDTGAHDQCTYPHAPQVDARAHLPLFVALPVAPVIATLEHLSTPATAPLAPLDPGVPRPPVAVAYCRYLF